MAPQESQVRRHCPLPQGYTFVPKGDVYITKHCRKQTHEAGKTLFVVVDKNNKPVGLRCPTHIHAAVMEQNKATAAARAAAMQKRDAAIEENFEEAILKVFPTIPKTEIGSIVKHTAKKGARRVGRAGTVPLEERVELAVRAHLRHVHTDYEWWLKRGMAGGFGSLEVEDSPMLDADGMAPHFSGSAVKTDQLEGEDLDDSDEDMSEYASDATSWSD
ncbi:hypothetical protein N0V88_005726 [Collariella sp. IMI 366227]|nr:hypothetical protein N0V88_005726 [Collariella sp. IMI 366227]